MSLYSYRLLDNQCPRCAADLGQTNAILVNHKHFGYGGEEGRLLESESENTDLILDIATPRVQCNTCGWVLEVMETLEESNSSDSDDHEELSEEELVVNGQLFSDTQKASYLFAVVKECDGECYCGRAFSQLNGTLLFQETGFNTPGEALDAIIEAV